MTTRGGEKQIGAGKADWSEAEYEKIQKIWMQIEIELGKSRVRQPTLHSLNHDSRYRWIETLNTIIIIEINSFSPQAALPRELCPSRRALILCSRISCWNSSQNANASLNTRLVSLLHLRRRQRVTFFFVQFLYDCWAILVCLCVSTLFSLNNTQSLPDCLVLS